MDSLCAIVARHLWAVKEVLTSPWAGSCAAGDLTASFVQKKGGNCCGGFVNIVFAIARRGSSAKNTALHAPPLDPAGCEGHHDAMLIFKIFRAEEWAQLRQNGETTGAPIDVADGYVHFSTATQAAETAAKHFAGVGGLFLIAVDSDAAGEALKWEVSRGDALFPHLYRKLTLDDVVWAQALPLEDGVHQFPAGLEEASQ